jgi:hypothetical protein
MSYEFGLCQKIINTYALSEVSVYPIKYTPSLKMLYSNVTNIKVDVYIFLTVL